MQKRKQPGILGIDPGNMGGIAVRFGDSLAHTKAFKLPLPDKKDKYRKSDLDTLAILINLHETFDIKHCYYEKVTASPQMGVTSAFTFGKNYGLITGMLTALKIPTTYIHASGWQTEMGCLSRGDKKVTKARASELFPHLKVTNGVADALLISEYGWRKFHGKAASFGAANPSSSSIFSSDKKHRLDALDLL